MLRLRAYHEAGQVHLEIIDDGAGIDPQRIAAKALERGLVTPAQLAAMSPPGDHPADLPARLLHRRGGHQRLRPRGRDGRGEDPDRGHRRLGRRQQHGSGRAPTFRLTIPLTLAIIPALTIGCAGRRYAVPQVSVLELVRLSGEHARGGIELISGAPVYRLRDTLLPLVRLDEQLGLVPARDIADEAAADDGRRTCAAASSSCCTPSSSASAWSWTTCWTPRRSWSSRSGGT